MTRRTLPGEPSTPAVTWLLLRGAFKAAWVSHALVLLGVVFGRAYNRLSPATALLVAVGTPLAWVATVIYMSWDPGDVLYWFYD